jgi:anti-anti-sigma factor
MLEMGLGLARSPSRWRFVGPHQGFLMELQVDDVGATVNCVRLSGRLDAPGADRIGVRFTASASVPGRHAMIDLSEVSFLASMGIRLLIATARSARARNSTQPSTRSFRSSTPKPKR